MSHNGLTRSIQNEIVNLKDASLMPMSFNKIKGKIPSGAMKFTNLQFLRLHGIQIRVNDDYMKVLI